MNQELMDAIFEIAQLSAVNFCRDTDSDYYNLERELHMKWVSRQLSLLGYSTTPMGSSWGILDG